MNAMQEKRPEGLTEENRIAGTVGAFLFALVGGIIYFALAQIGYLASVSGLVAVVCALKGYELFAKKESKFGIVISVLMSVLVISIAWYLSLSLDVYRAYQGWYETGEIDYVISFGDAVRNAYIFLSDAEIAISYFLDLLIGIALCALGCITPIRVALHRTKKAADAPVPEIQTDTASGFPFASNDIEHGANTQDGPKDPNKNE